MQFNKMLTVAALAAAPMLIASVAFAQGAGPGGGGGGGGGRTPTPNPTPEQTAAAVAEWKSDWPASPPAAADDPYKAFYPDATHVPFILPKDIPWTGKVGGEQQFKVVGDPSKPGPYILLLKWWPGNFSKPHFHGMPRFITVLSGTWWVNSTTHYDPDKTYPLGPGTLVQDIIGTVHWDGTKADSKEPVVLEIVGEGPVPNVNVDENGKPLGKNSF